MQDFSSEPVKRLYRSRYDRMISGVCGGIADYLSIDVILIRILWIIITLFGGIGLFIYIAGIIIIPENPSQEEADEDNKPIMRNDKTLFWGALLIIVGAILIFREMGFFHYFHIWDIPWQIIWAVLLILLGVFLLYNRSKNGEQKTSEGSEPVTDQPSETKRQVYRSRTDKMMAGVCGGLAEYFSFDATIVRLAYVLLSLASVGLGILVYIVMVFVFPEKPEDYMQNSDGAETK